MFSYQISIENRESKKSMYAWFFSKYTTGWKNPTKVQAVPGCVKLHLCLQKMGK